MQSLFDGVKEHAEVLSALFTALMPDSIYYVRKNLKETVTTVDHNLVLSCFRLFDSLVLQFAREEGTALDANTKAQVCQCFLFSRIIG